MNSTTYIDNLISGRLLGINFAQEDVFNQGAESFIIVVGISMPDLGETVLVEARNIVQLTWENEINSFNMTGELIFRDTKGQFGGVMNTVFGRVTVGLVRLEREEQKGDSTIMMQDKNNIFTHSFLIDKSEIMDRAGNDVVYKLHLISETWLLSRRLLYWTNFDKDVINKPEEDFNVFNILLELCRLAFSNLPEPHDLYLSGSGIEESDFTEAAGDCPGLVMKFASNTRTTLDSAFNYLMDRSYYMKDKHDKALRIFVYDAFNKVFRLLNFKNAGKFVKTNGQTMLVSMSGGIYESFTTPTKQNFASLNIVPAREFMESFIKYTWFDFNSVQEEATGGERKDMNSTLTTDDLVKYVDPGDVPKGYVYKMADGSPSRKAFDIIFNKQFSPPTIDYTKIDSAWNTTYSLYRNQINNTMYKDAVVFNTNGRIRHNPGTLVGIANERHADIGEDAKSATSKDHQDITDVFFVVKTTHIVRPADPYEEKFTENLVMTKWWSATA